MNPPRGVDVTAQMLPLNLNVILSQRSIRRLLVRRPKSAANVVLRKTVVIAKKPAMKMTLLKRTRKNDGDATGIPTMCHYLSALNSAMTTNISIYYLFFLSFCTSPSFPPLALVCVVVIIPALEEATFRCYLLPDIHCFECVPRGNLSSGQSQAAACHKRSWGGESFLLRLIGLSLGFHCLLGFTHLGCYL